MVSAWIFLLSYIPFPLASSQQESDFFGQYVGCQQLSTSPDLLAHSPTYSGYLTRSAMCYTSVARVATFTAASAWPVPASTDEANECNYCPLLESYALRRICFPDCLRGKIFQYRVRDGLGSPSG